MSGDKPSGTAARWVREIERSAKYFEPWHSRAEKIKRLYRRQPSESEGGNAKRQFAMLWANTEILKTTIYAKAPVPQVSRRYKDQDPSGRIAAELLERALAHEFDRQDVHQDFRQVRDDLMLSARGTAWVRYEADTADDRVGDERAQVEFVLHTDFLHGIAPSWKKVPWVAKRALMDREDFAARFPEIDIKAVEFSHKAEKEASGATVEKPDDEEAKAEVWEIWDKRRRKVLFVSKGYADVIEEAEPFVDFRGFFPCPPPVYATTTPDTLIPVPDYVYYQDQAEEINRLTERIGKLTDSLKVVGFYPAGASSGVSAAIEKALSPDTENAMIGVESWAAFGEKGAGNAIVYLPIKEIADTIVRCIELRKELIQDVYQITGISDIVRGATDPNETLGAQELKAQWGSIRVRDRQQEFARFCRDVTRLLAEIVAERFQPERVMEMANVKLPPQQPPQPGAPPQPDPMAEVFKLLRDDRMRGFRIDIETDSTIQPDEDAEKQRRVEFITAVGGFMVQAQEVAQVQPALVPVIGEMLLFLVRGFRAGRVLEDTIETAIQQVTQAVQQGAQNDPEQKKLEAEMQKTRAELQMRGQEHEMDMTAKREEMEIKRQAQVMDLQGQREKMAVDMQAGQQRLAGMAQQQATRAMTGGRRR